MDAFHALNNRIRAEPDMKAKMEIAGLAREPVEEDGVTKACDNCIYYLGRRAWCDLPALNIPVDPDWYCILWRV